MTNRHEEKQPNRSDGKICQLDVLIARYSADQMLRAREHHHNYTNWVSLKDFD